MKIGRIACIALTASAWLAGCAATQDGAYQSRPRESTTAITGSRIPSSGGSAQAVGAVDRDTWMDHRREGSRNPLDRAQ